MPCYEIFVPSHLSLLTAAFLTKYYDLLAIRSHHQIIMPSNHFFYMLIMLPGYHTNKPPLLNDI